LAVHSWTTEVLAQVRAACLEGKVGEDREDAGDGLPDCLAPDVDVAGDVVLEDRILGVHRDDRLTSCAFQAAL
jgi:hypothetical protein